MIFFLAVAIYGSYVPWNYAPIDWNTTLERFGQTPYLNLGVGHRADWVANILLFVPLGFCGLAILTLGEPSPLRRTLAFGGVVCLGCFLSLGIEFGQIWFPLRTVSQNDVLAELL